MVTPGSVQDNHKKLLKKLIKLGDIPHTPLGGIFTLNQQPEPELYASDVKSQDAPDTVSIKFKVWDKQLVCHFFIKLYTFFWNCDDKTSKFSSKNANFYPSCNECFKKRKTLIFENWEKFEKRYIIKYEHLSYKFSCFFTPSPHSSLYIIFILNICF